jgi:ketosteroid isomerase-like protein
VFDVEDYLACWSDDGVRSGVGGECRGKVDLREHWNASRRALVGMVFFTQIAMIEVDGDRAAARCHCREVLHLKDGRFRKLVGRYDDELVRVEGDWVFAHRRYQLVMDEGAPLTS